MKQSALILMVLLLTSLLSGCVGIVDSETKEALMEIEKQHKANDISKHIDTIHVQVSGENRKGIINGTIEIHYPTEHLFKPVLTIDVKYDYGMAKLRNSSRGIYSKIPYLIGFNGEKLYYDALYDNKPETTLRHPYTNLIFEDVIKVGTINDCNSVNTDEFQVQNINLNNNTSFTFEICIGGDYGKIKNPVLSFVNDWNNNPFEYTEFETVTLEHVSGLDVNAPRDITEIIKRGTRNVPLSQEIDANGDRWINAGSYAVYRLTFHETSRYQLSDGDIMWVYLDDLDGYHNGDIFRSAKADAAQVAKIYSTVESVTIDKKGAFIYNSIDGAPSAFDNGVPPEINSTLPTLQWDEFNESVSDAKWVHT